MSKKPKVSIGLPVFNGQEYLKETINSILNQTFSDFELIISDNASDDQTAKICETYVKQDKRIRYLKQSKNIGWIKNYEFTLENATGNYFFWIAADDPIEPNFIFLLLNCLKENPFLIGAMSDVKHVDSKGNFLKLDKLDNIRVENIQNNLNKTQYLFFQNPTSNVFFCIYGIFKKEYLKKVSLNYQNRNMYSSQVEIPFLAQLALLGSIASIPKCLKIYRHHRSSIYSSEQLKISEYNKIKHFFNVTKILWIIILKSKLKFHQKIFSFYVLIFKGAIQIIRIIKNLINLLRKLAIKIRD